MVSTQVIYNEQIIGNHEFLFQKGILYNGFLHKFHKSKLFFFDCKNYLKKQDLHWMFFHGWLFKDWPLDYHSSGAFSTGLGVVAHSSHNQYLHFQHITAFSTISNPEGSLRVELFDASMSLPLPCKTISSNLLIVNDLCQNYLFHKLRL